MFLVVSVAVVGGGATVTVSLCEGLDEDLHASPETEHQVEGGLLLDVIVSQGPAVFELLTSEDEPLLVGGNTLLVLDLGLHVFNRVRGLDVQGDGLASQSLDEDLHLLILLPRNSDQLEPANRNC